MPEQLPVWNNPGIEPSTDLKVNGWQPGQKPSAQHFNWLFNRTYKCLEELQGDSSKITELEQTLTELEQTVTLNNEKFNEHLADFATTQDFTLYVNASTGNDANDGKSVSTPFKTIQAAINSLPKFINHTVTINIASGIYDENVKINCMGIGLLLIQGDENTPSNVKISSIEIRETKVYVGLFGFKLTTTSKDSLFVERTFFVQARKLEITESSNSKDGINVNGSNVLIETSTISNRNRAIYGRYGARILSNNNYGTGNAAGLAASFATIMKNGEQPTGTVAEITDDGGVIR